MVKAAGQAPADLDEVRNAFRLGWAIAELRGRYRRDLRPKGPPRATAEMARTDDALPLANERSWKEQRIEVIRAITALSDVLKLDFPVKGKVKADQLDPTFRTLDHRATDKKAWNTLTYRFYRWDAQIQDALIMRPSEAAAYQLGRGLAETYWALD